MTDPIKKSQTTAGGVKKSTTFGAKGTGVQKSKTLKNINEASLNDEDEMTSEYGFNPLGKKAPTETKPVKKETKDLKDESYSPVKDSQKDRTKKQSTSPYKRGRDPYEED